mmetsp:Transcript_5266/g.15278  ORF Transcript_5266/g.15278 Transcript_5266/m.15278 type:complete len:91 (-) Transcript_5266:4285-4557(-)
MPCVIFLDAVFSFHCLRCDFLLDMVWAQRSASFAIGIVISSILMSAVDSAVNTVIVCFAEAPAEGHSSHSELCEELVDAWMKIYPDDCGF